MRFKLTLIGLVILSAISFVVARRDATPVHEGHAARAVTVFKTPTCGCCGNYVAYLRTKNYEVEVVDFDQEALDKKKQELGVPDKLGSCHTTVVKEEGYFVEGHIPYEAIERLLSEKPDVKGIGMPGMPSASPGMLGSKTEPFAISLVDNDGAVSPYLTL